jgi:phosphohistidine phosphatase
MELYIIRHGIALAHGTPDVAEDERPLTSKGQKRMRQVARGLRRLGVAPDRIVTSPLPRAAETAEIVAAALRLSDRLETADALRADRDAASIRDWVAARTEARLMIVGHNPALSELVGLLAVGPAARGVCELRKGGVAALVSRPDGGFALDWVASPRLLRLAADA